MRGIIQNYPSGGRGGAGPGWASWPGPAECVRNRAHIFIQIKAFQVALDNLSAKIFSFGMICTEF